MLRTGGMPFVRQLHERACRIGRVHRDDNREPVPVCEGDVLSNKDMSATCRRLTHVGQNLNALVIIPKDQFEDVGVSDGKC